MANGITEGLHAFWNFSIAIQLVVTKWYMNLPGRSCKSQLMVIPILYFLCLSNQEEVVGWILHWAGPMSDCGGQSLHSELQWTYNVSENQMLVRM